MESEVSFTPDQMRIFTQLEWLLEQVGNAYADFIEVIPNSLPKVDRVYKELGQFIEALTKRMQGDSSFVPMEAIMNFLNRKAQELIDLMQRERNEQAGV